MSGLFSLGSVFSYVISYRTEVLPVHTLRDGVKWKSNPGSNPFSIIQGTIPNFVELPFFFLFFSSTKKGNNPYLTEVLRVELENAWQVLSSWWAAEQWNSHNRNVFGYSILYLSPLSTHCYLCPQTIPCCKVLYETDK